MRSSVKLRLSSTLACVSLAFAAHADQFRLTYTVAGASADLILTADPIPTATELYHITGISGTREGQKVTSFAAGGPEEFMAEGRTLDNVLYFAFGSYRLSERGIFYRTALQGYNVRFLGRNFLTLVEDSPGGVEAYSGDFFIAPVPEPSAWATLGLGAALLRRRRK